MTIVVDSSVVAELLLGTEAGRRSALHIGEHHLIAPQHLTAEVASVVRGWSLGGHITDEQALRLFREFDELGIEQIAMSDFQADVYELRHNLSAYDAFYVVLARAAKCALLTLDVRVARAAPDCAVLPETGGAPPS